jgi:hypothetical protein
VTPFLVVLAIWFFGVLVRVAYLAFERGNSGFQEPEIDLDDFIGAFFWFIALPVFLVWLVIDSFIELFFFIGRNCK